MLMPSRPQGRSASTAVAPGSKVLDGQFASVQQAIGLRRDRGPEAHGYLEQFVSWATGSGLIAGLIDQHQVKGLSVARPPAT